MPVQIRDPIGEVNRLLDVVGDEDRGLPGLGPDRQQLELHELVV